MRDPTRIAVVLKVIEEVWEENPDLRLMQLLGNVVGPDSFYMEDDELIECIARGYHS